MLVLKITIRLLVIYKRITKFGTANFYTRRLYLDRMGNLVKSRNILARIEGTSNNSKAYYFFLITIAHPFLLNGASDAGSGVATIFKAFAPSCTKKHIKWYYYLVFGCRRIRIKWSGSFATQHNGQKKWDSFLILKPGTSGPSYMLMETNGEMGPC
jgi:hypothetical protein